MSTYPIVSLNQHHDPAQFKSQRFTGAISPLHHGHKQKNCFHIFHSFNSSWSNVFSAGCTVQWDQMAMAHLHFGVHWTATHSLDDLVGSMLKAVSKPAAFEPILHRGSRLQRFCPLIIFFQLGMLGRISGTRPSALHLYDRTGFTHHFGNKHIPREHKVSACIL